jgi:hypothetical protein
MEVAKGEHGETEFRTYAGADSFMPISDYALVCPTNDAKNIFLTLFWTTSGKSACISEDDVTGLLVRIPDVSFNPDANYWYQDKQGRHPIIKGTAQSWRKHLKEWCERPVDSEWKRKLQQTLNAMLQERQEQSAGVTSTNVPTRTRGDIR